LNFNSDGIDQAIDFGAACRLPFFSEESGNELAGWE